MSAPDIHTFLGMAAGLLLVAVPARLSKRIEAERAARLTEIEAGASESYFEEKRALQAYPSPLVEILRAAGFLLLSLSLGPVLAKYMG